MPPIIPDLTIPLTNFPKLEITKTLSSLLGLAMTPQLIKFLENIGEKNFLPPISEDKKIIIIDDEPKNLILQMAVLVCLGVHPENIQLFCLNTDKRRYEAIKVAVCEFMNVLKTSFEDRLEPRDGQDNQTLSCFNKIEDLVAKIKEYRGQNMEMHILLDMQMSASDHNQASSRTAGARIIESFLQSEELRNSMLDENLGIIITSSNSVNQIFTEEDFIKCDDKTISISVDQKKEQIRFCIDDKWLVIPRNPNGKLEVISYKKIINILKALDGGVDPKDENMRPLVKFLTDGVGLGNMVPT